MQSPDLLNSVPVTVRKAWACALLLDTLPVRNHAGMGTDLPVRNKRKPPKNLMQVSHHQWEWPELGLAVEMGKRQAKNRNKGIHSEAESGKWLDVGGRGKMGSPRFFFGRQVDHYLSKVRQKCRAQDELRHNRL